MSLKTSGLARDVALAAGAVGEHEVDVAGAQAWIAAPKVSKSLMRGLASLPSSTS